MGFLQNINQRGGGRGIAVNALTKLIYENYFAPRLSEQQSIQQNQIVRQGLKTRPQQPQPQRVNVNPAQVDPYSAFAGARQFKSKANKPVDAGLMKLVIDIANRYKIDPKLAGAVAIQESDWNPNATGGTNPPGYGLYQLTPGANKGRWDQTRLFEAEYNADEGLKMIRSGLDDGEKMGFSGDKLFRHALRRYNGGPEYWKNVPGWGGKTRNQNTKAYADSVMNWYKQ